jgi:steroid delta-isomerase-like uncharacterized protein
MRRICVVRWERKGKAIMQEESKALALRAWELVNQRDFDALDEVYAVDAVVHNSDRELQNLEEARQFIGTYFDAFPDLHFTIEDVIAEDEKAVTRWTSRGTHQGEIEELGPPTARLFELEGISIHRIEAGRIVEAWERYDNLSFLQQLGLVPEQQQAEA